MTTKPIDIDTDPSRPLEVEAFLPWFQGYTENVDGLPTLEQWRRVCFMINRVGIKFHEARRLEDARKSMEAQIALADLQHKASIT